jgi:hypothetical protein
MRDPRRLSQSGGASKRLLDSASIDKPSAAARRRAVLAATASSFASTQSGGTTSPAAQSRGSTAKTLATWVLIGAAASGTLALLGSKLLDSGSGRTAASQPSAGMAVLPEPAAPPSAVPIAAPAPPHIAAEPASPPPTAATAPTSSSRVKPAASARPVVPRRSPNASD